MAGGELQLRIEGRALPGRRGDGHAGVHLGIQRGKAVVDLVPGDAAVASFALTVEARVTGDGGFDFRGPFAHGKPGARHIYLCWVERGAAGETATIARAKLFLGDIDRDLVTEALDRGIALTGSLALTGRSGMPVSGGIRPPDIRWAVSGDIDG